MSIRFPQGNLIPRRGGKSVHRVVNPSQKSVSKEVIDSRRKGVIANYNNGEGFGFVVVVPEENRRMYDANLFTHHSGMTVQHLKKGDFVEFDVAVGRKGLEAINLTLSDFIPPPDCDGMSNTESSRGNADRVTESRIGEVIKFNHTKRFGIIKCKQTGMTILAHHSKLVEPLTELVVGQTVKFKMTAGPKESIACEVEVISEAPDSQSEVSGSPHEELKSDSKPARKKRKPKQSDRKDMMFDCKTDVNTDDKKSSVDEAVNLELTCSMCLDILSEDSLYTPCEHNFCRDCIEPWIKRKSFCPECKAELLKDDLQPVPRFIKNLIKTASV